MPKRPPPGEYYDMVEMLITMGLPKAYKELSNVLKKEGFANQKPEKYIKKQLNLAIATQFDTRINFPNQARNYAMRLLDVWIANPFVQRN